MARMNPTSAWSSRERKGPDEDLTGRRNYSFQVDMFVDADKAEAQFARLETLLSPAVLATFLGGPVVEHFQDKFNRFFEQQGTDNQAWQPLSEVTIMDREAQGFGPGPINERTGQMRAYVTESPGDIRILGTLSVLTYPGKTPSGEMGRKLKTAQKGGTFQGHSVPARPVIDADETDMLYLMSALTFFLDAGMS